MSALEHISQFTKNEKLKCLLLNLYEHSTSSSHSNNAFVYSGYINNSLNGLWYPKGGSEYLTKCLAGCISSNDGIVLTGKKVKSILSNGYQAIGVEMENGIKIYAKSIISGVGMYNTYFNFLCKTCLHNRIFRYVNEIKENITKCGFSESAIYLFIGMNDNAANLDLVNYDTTIISGISLIHDTNEILYPINKDEYLSKQIKMT